MGAKKVKSLTRFIGGIGEYSRESTIQDAYAFGRSIDVRSDPHNITLLPRTIRESGTVITALPKWGEYISSCDKTYIYDEAGNIYSRNADGVSTLIHTTPNSHGNGIGWFGEDNFLYYTSDKLIGRYGPVCSDAATFADDFFGSQGGTPLNTHSLDLEASSTQYASRADTASLSVTGNLSLEAWIKLESLPTSNNPTTIISKWTESGNARSYKLGITTESNFFGNGSDGALTISSNTTEAPIDSACTGTINTNTLSATNASFAADQIVMVHQTRGTGAGNWQKNKIQSYTAGTITLVNPLNATYSSGAQVRVLKQYTTVTVNSGFTYSAKAWDGSVGGILAFLANSTVTINGAISAVGSNGVYIGPTDAPGTNINRTPRLGFGGGEGVEKSGSNTAIGYRGEGTSGDRTTQQIAANGSGGGGGQVTGGFLNSRYGAGGGGGGNGTAGSSGATNGPASTAGSGGGTSGAADLTTLTFGGGGGGGAGDGGSEQGSGGSGGGVVFMAGPTITTGASASINASGGAGGSIQLGGASVGGGGAGGGGAGGSILIKAQTATLGANVCTAVGGAGGNGLYGASGGAGGDGRIHLDYYTSYSGTTNPTLHVSQDSNLGSVDGYALFLSISSNGTNTETFTKPANIMTDVWQHVAATWTQSIKTAKLYLNAVSLGTVVGTLSSISNNASTFNIGMDRDSSSNPQHLFDGLIDEVRVWAGVRAESDILRDLYTQINSASAGLVGYYTFNNSATDGTANANNLTLTGSPVYSIDVPFAASTTRVDIDQADTAATGQTYTLLTAIAETSADKKEFTPAKDPQKSVRVYIDTVGAGTGSWTLTIHDQYNNVIASKTVAKADLPTGDYEFVFDEVWRPLTNFTNSYHIHITDSDGTGTVKTSSAGNLATVNYTTYYQFLVEDTGFHPISKMLQLMVIGNERYVATYEATIYNPNAITLPAGHRVRCFGYWQEYLAIGTIRGDAITDQDIGRIYFWDGIASTYNFFVDVPEGGVSALLGAQGKLHVWAGYQGDHLVYESGNSVQKLRRVPFMENNKYMEMYPGAVTMWKSLIRYGVAGASDSEAIHRGVYTYGSNNSKYPDVLTFDYPVSTGNTQGTSLRIGLLMTINQRLLIGWADGTGYGLDYVDSDNECYPTGTIEFLIDDNNLIWKEKLAQTFVTKTKALTEGQSITPKVKLDDATVWTLGEATTSASLDPTITRFTQTYQRNYEHQYGLDIASSSGISPTIKGSGLEDDELEEENRV